jgi:phosphatidylinositol alpha-1,6-mannosyltransferase
MKRIVKSLDYLGYLGDYTKSVLLKLGAIQNKLIQIAPGIDIEHFSPKGVSEQLLAKHKLTGKRVVISVGRLVHRKGQDQLIKALPEVLKKFPDTVLLLVGDGPIRRMLENSATQLGVRNNVVFVGRVSYQQLPEYLNLAEIFAMPVRSRFFGLEVEGLGIVYLEASACGLPIIAGDSGGAPDAVIKNITGLIVDGVKSDEIADAICKLLAEPALAKQMGQSGRDWVRENWQLANWSLKFNKMLFSD